MSKVLGLDLGTNSIGWAIVDTDKKQIIKAGSRIIPTDTNELSSFEKGKTKSAAAERRAKRGARRLNERAELRRERLLRVLNVLNFLPEHYAKDIDFEKHLGQFKESKQPLIAYKPTENGKREFLFMKSFNEMLKDFKNSHPELVANNKKIPYDWTIYYLRKKALTQPISKEELAWILLNFNTKRGYYQLRGEEEENTNKKEEENTNKKEEYAVLTVTDVVNTGADRKKPQQNWYEITYDREGCVQKKLSINPPKKIGDEVELIITTTISKSGEVKVSLREPKEDDWTLQKKRTEHLIDAENVTVGQYIYDNILANPNVKIRGKLVNVVERKYYREELNKILEKQIQCIPELQDKNLLLRCYQELYRNNDIHIKTRLSQGFKGLFLNDILFYQRPLKSKKSEIADCPFEYHTYRDKEGKLQKEYLKCTPKSNLYFQEFRLWQFVQNLKIYAKTKEVDGKLKANYDITDELIRTDEDRAALFDWLNNKKDIKQDQVLKYFKLDKQSKEYKEQYYWNYVSDKTYPCNETHYLITSSLNKMGEDDVILNFNQEYALWHILYSVNDPTELRKALETFANKNNLDEITFVDAFKKTKPFASDYAAFSEKAIKKLLPLMRCGKYWNENLIEPKIKDRLTKLLETLKKIEEIEIEIIFNTFNTGEVTDNNICIKKDIEQVQEFVKKHKIKNIKEINNEDDQKKILNNLLDILINPGEIDNTIAKEAIIQVYRFAHKNNRTFEEIKDFQNIPSWLAVTIVYDKPEITKWEKIEDIDEYLKNFKHNSLRNPVVEKVLLESIRVVRDIYAELHANNKKIDEIHIEMGRQLKQTAEERKKETNKINKNQEENLRLRNELEDFKTKNNQTQPITTAELLKYRLYKEQKEKSPYTGQPIELSKLFTSAYQIDHIIPQSRWYNDSIDNKVVCESEVNQNKGNMLAYEYIIDAKGKIVEGSCGKNYNILSKEEYEGFVRQHYSNNKQKMRNLLLEDVPQEFTNNQLANSRYIARKASEVFSHLTGKDKVIFTNGAITDRLKAKWGINDIWNDIITPRFERLNKIIGEKENRKCEDFGIVNDKNKFCPTVPTKISKGFSKKRIDHRHHAMDAIIIACTNPSIIKYQNIKHARGERQDTYPLAEPWNDFPKNVKEALEKIVVSFKQDLHIMSKPNNLYWHYDNNGKKILAKQDNEGKWIIRRPLHAETFYSQKKVKDTSKFPVGESGEKRKQYVKAAKDTNLFFAVYYNKDKKKREYETIPLRDVIANKIEHKEYVPKLKEEDTTKSLLFTLSPLDLVYMPEEGENIDLLDINNLDKSKIYKFVSCTGNQAFFVPCVVAKPIANKSEFNALNKIELDDNGRSIKENCYKLDVDRLGNITKIYKY